MMRKASATVPVLILIGLIGGAIVMQNPGLVPTLGNAVENLDVDAILASFSGTDSEACSTVEQSTYSGQRYGNASFSCTCTEVLTPEDVENISSQQIPQRNVTIVTYTVEANNDTIDGYAQLDENKNLLNTYEYQVNGEYTARFDEELISLNNEIFNTCSLK